MELKHKEIRDCQAEMCGSQRADRTADVVGRNGYRVCIGKLRYLARDREAADFLQVRRGNSDGVRLQNLLEALKEKKIFTSGDRNSDFRAYRAQRLHALWRNWIFEPQQPERLQSTGHLDDVAHAIAPVTIGRDINFVAHGLAHRADE